MCSTFFRELKNKKGYDEVRYLMRVSNVPNNKIGYELLEIAIMSYLHNPNLHLEELVNIALTNSPMTLMNEQECFEEMKEALQRLHTKHSEKLEDDNAVFKFIRNIASEVRIHELIQQRIISKDLKAVGQEIETTFCKVALRRIMKPNATFMEVLNHIARRCNYKAVEDLVIDLYKIVKNSDYEEELRKYDENGIMKEKRRKKISKELLGDVEELVMIFVREKDNIVF